MVPLWALYDHVAADIRAFGFDSEWDFFVYAAKAWGFSEDRAKKDFGIYLREDKRPFYVINEHRNLRESMPDVVAPEHQPIQWECYLPVRVRWWIMKAKDWLDR